MRRLAIVAVGAAIGLLLWWPRTLLTDGGRRGEQGEPGATAAAPVASAVPGLGMPTAPRPSAAPVTASLTPLSRADRMVGVAEEAKEARANRQRLLFDTLTDLSVAAERAEREGNPAYAAALRRRADVLGKGVRAD